MTRSGRGLPVGTRVGGEPVWGAPLLVLATGLTFLLGFDTPYAVPLTVSATLLLAVAWLSRAVARGDVVRLMGDRAVFDPVVLLAVAVIVSAVLSPVARDALTWGFREGTGAPYWTACLLVFAFASFVSVGPGVRRALSVTAVTLTVAGLVGAIQARTGMAPADTVFGGSNYLGPAVAAIVPVLLGLTRTAGSATERWGMLLATLVAAAAAIGSGSVTASLALAAGVAGCALWRPSLLGFGVRQVRLVRGTAAAVCALIIALVLVAALTDVIPGPVDSVVDRELAGPSFTQRVELWQVALRASAQRPWTGWGPDAFPYAAQSHFDAEMLVDLLYAREGFVPDPRTIMPPDPHSFPLAILAELGVGGALLFALVAGVWLARVFRLPDGPERARDLRASFGVSVMALGVASLLVPLSTTNGLTFVLLAGLAMGGPRPNRSRRSTDGDRRAAMVAAAALTAVVVVVSAPFFAATGIAAAALDGSQGAAAAAGRLAQAQRYAPTRSVIAYQKLWVDANRLGADMRFDEFATRYQQAPSSVTGFAPYSTELVRIALDRTPTHEVRVWAEQRLAQAEAVAPEYPEVDLERARLASMRGDDARARELLEEVSWASASARYRSYEAVIGGAE